MPHQASPEGTGIVDAGKGSPPEHGSQDKVRLPCGEHHVSY